MIAAIQNETADYGNWIRRMGKDNRLLATHVSLFTALFICWQRSGFASPFAVTRRTLMAFSKIASIATYHKCMRELHEYGYIRYQPSYHPAKGSLVYLPFTEKTSSRE
ncbi:hypothetical protein [Sphingobacterium sp. JB170]|uniref:hypothetical protein n=1 Tax=Sphingobacterium sp. JB170 TaxID=1434842 RepID=UPI00097EF5FB|nr:hypothetical protein [Sphingobacterium sp. JB170]SJN18513.1 hypothetical protein FM107_01400 [Sphingobacterium sp. JB170]